MAGPAYELIGHPNKVLTFRLLQLTKCLCTIEIEATYTIATATTVIWEECEHKNFCRWWNTKKVKWMK